MHTWKNYLFIPLFLAILAVGVSGTDSWARGWGMGGGCGMGGGHGFMAADPQQAAQMFDLHEKFRNETAGLRKEMVVKRAELGALWREKDPDQNKIQAKQKELNALRDKMQEKSLPLRMEMRKLCPRGPGGKMAGFGPGMGMGPGGPPPAE